MTKVIFVLSSISSGLLLFWSVSHTAIYENLEWYFFKNASFVGEISNNWPNDLFGAKLLNLVDNHCYQLTINY